MRQSCERYSVLEMLSHGQNIGGMQLSAAITSQATIETMADPGWYYC
jgi:hypothetical protein